MSSPSSSKSILGNSCESTLGGGGGSLHLPKTLSNFLSKNTDMVGSALKGTLKRKKERGKGILNTVKK